MAASAAERPIVYASASNVCSYVRYFDDFPVVPLNNIWDDTEIGHRERQGLRRPDQHRRSSSAASS